MAHRINKASSADLIKKSVMLSSGPPMLYRLCTTRSNLDKDGKIRKWTFGQKCANMENKIILTVGETGTGKTTLINTMANYFLGVKFEDHVWFEITEEHRRDQTESQTSEITAYEIFSEKKLTSLTIIDTPGYGDTRGIDKDMEIAQNLHDLFLHETGVKDLDAVCLVLKASQNRISEVQRYIFEAVLSLFGKDIEDIIMLFITHSDGGPPTNVLEAIKKEKIPCCHDEENEPVHFLFNNRQSEKQTKKYEYVYRSSWEMATGSIAEFFRFLKSRQRKSLNMTVSVLEERMQLKACVENLKERIKYSEAKWTELTYVQQALKQNKEKIEKDKTFMFTVKIAYKEKVDISGASWQDRKVTSCKECEENCHEFGCWLAGSPRLCKVMKESHCVVCNCHYSSHVREDKKYVTKQREERVTFEELKKKYSTTAEEKATYNESALKCVETEHEKLLRIKEMMTSLEICLKTHMEKNEDEKRGLVNNAYVAIVKLSEIALKPDSAFTVQYLDFLIPRVEEVGTAGWAQKLKDMQKAADKESTKSAVGYLSRINVDTQKAAAEFANSVAGYISKMSKDMQKTTYRESAHSAEGPVSRTNKDMQKLAIKEPSNSAGGSVRRMNNDIQKASDKQSTHSAVGSGKKVNTDTQKATDKESSHPAAGYVRMMKDLFSGK
ncbi:hypothetical protein AOLI_G00198320 [Acnodon oligacanthus]